ncbi:phage tail protein [Paenibacillus fonticola]|uniref:phage tail protein n=1 Tax=Paenibacillus fonticola TaxID=379896 RepID=UPI0003726685|nr:tail fiber protein [Paenibacillus fonticola]
MEPFTGEIRLFANGYAPQGWALCEGQILQINTNQALFSIIRNYYGGDGVTTFALPDLRGRVPLHVSSAIQIGTSSGESSHTLTTSELPQHTHQINASKNDASSASPLNNIWAKQDNYYGSASSLIPMNDGAISSSGSSESHSNMQPFLTLNFCIALQGIYPSRN